MNHNLSRFQVAGNEPSCPFGDGLAKDIIFSSTVEELRGSPSLVGRGIANPMSERTRGFEILEGSFLRRRTAKNRNGYPTPRATFFTNLLVTYYKSIIRLN
jgi:hypothetical protein